MTSRIRVSPRGTAGAAVRFGVPLLALIFALAVGAVILTIAGNNPIGEIARVYRLPTPSTEKEEQS